MGVGAGVYMCDAVKKSSRSLSHLLMSSCMFLVSSLFFFVWFPCGRLSWLHVSFWAHVNIVHHIIS